MDQKTKERILNEASQGKVIAVGTYVGTKRNVGQSISKETGKSESWGSTTHTVLLGADICLVKVYARGPDEVAAVTAAEKDEKMAAMQNPAEKGDLVLVYPRAMTFDKGVVRITGDVIPA